MAGLPRKGEVKMKTIKNLFNSINLIVEQINNVHTGSLDGLFNVSTLSSPDYWNKDKKRNYRKAMSYNNCLDASP